MGGQQLTESTHEGRRHVRMDSDKRTGQTHATDMLSLKTTSSRSVVRGPRYKSEHFFEESAHRVPRCAIGRAAGRGGAPMRGGCCASLLARVQGLPLLSPASVSPPPALGLLLVWVGGPGGGQGGCRLHTGFARVAVPPRWPAARPPTCRARMPLPATSVRKRLWQFIERRQDQSN